ncbi:MAG: CoA transferase [Acidobacteria bacterium]|nr:CoA transferase [Acidobacteriota bacterium]
MTNKTNNESQQLLSGVRVVDIGHAVAGPFACSLMADFGAEVIKIEQPGKVDTMRLLGPRKDGIALWWKVAGRNKKCITLNFQHERGREILLQLVSVSDVLVENFRPGTLQKYGLGWEDLRRVNPKLVMLSISGFGQTGPYSHKPGFGRIAEAFSGASQLTGEPDHPPMHVGYSLADTLSGLMGGFAVIMALYHRQVSGRNEGEYIDLALYEPLFRLIDWQAIVYQQLGEIPIRAGNRFPDILSGVVANVYRSVDGHWFTLSSATDSVTQRLLELTGGPELLSDPRFATPEARREHIQELDRILAEWIASRPAREIEQLFEEKGAVISRVYDIQDIFTDPQYRARANIIEVEDPDLRSVAMPGIIPKFERAPGKVLWTGPKLGMHNQDVYTGLLGLSDAELSKLVQLGVI